MRVAATRIGEVDGDSWRMRPHAWHSTRGTEKSRWGRSVADRQAAKEPRLAAMADEPVRTAGGASEDGRDPCSIVNSRLHPRGSRCGHNGSRERRSRDRVGSWTCWPSLELSSYSQEWSACPHFQAFRTLLPDEPKRGTQCVRLPAPVPPACSMSAGRYDGYAGT